ncbi:NAD(P)H-hydrate dehydratase, partial [Brevibacillus sp. SYSU BS000544]|uniref:NAD(P)H-hydrate dehydratase n=1 Tax=Brevibacillus sp. SYSU BS000544 TaxID=3416443 RepID=UPI003CE49326
YDGIIDGLIGTGTKGAPRSPYADIIQEVNRSKRPIISIDIPSGLDPDTGQLHDSCMKATRTVALAFLKRGLTQYPGLDAVGEVIVRTIGIWPSFADQFGIRTFLLSKTFLEEHFADSTDQPRQNNSHKGTYGHVLVCAGSQEMSGAGLLCSKAALRTGSGLVTWAVPESLVPSLMGLVPEVMLKGLAGKTHSLNSVEELLAVLTTRNIAVIGPGLGRFADDSRWLRTIWEQSSCPLVLDADALNMIADTADFAEWSLRSHPTILTPHPGEMARLLGVTTAEIQRNRIEIARSFAARHRVILVLKGARTVIATPDGAAYINPTGNPGMATGGSGDVLAGIIAGFIAQGLSADHAACFGVWLHGYAGDQAASKRKSPNSLIAGDIINEL